jgi:hypothetical protein
MELRDKLQHITGEFPVEQHPLMIQELASPSGHSIKLVDSQYPIAEFTCVVYSFGLTKDPIYLSVASFGFGLTFAGAQFIHFLLDHSLLTKRQTGQAFAGDLVVYFENDLFRHVGTALAGNQVLSKWGTGHLFEHSTWEVPTNYGDRVKYFKQLAPEEGLDLFKRYAEVEGFYF